VSPCPRTALACAAIPDSTTFTMTGTQVRGSRRLLPARNVLSRFKVKRAKAQRMLQALTSFPKVSIFTGTQLLRSGPRLSERCGRVTAEQGGRATETRSGRGGAGFATSLGLVEALLLLARLPHADA